MLVLSRKLKEAVTITIAGERVRITIAEIRGDRVRLGFEASPNIKIMRDEIQEQIDASVARESGPPSR